MLPADGLPQEFGASQAATISVSRGVFGRMGQRPSSIQVPANTTFAGVPPRTTAPCPNPARLPLANRPWQRRHDYSSVQFPNACWRSAWRNDPQPPRRWVGRPSHRDHIPAAANSLPTFARFPVPCRRAPLRVRRFGPRSLAIPRQPVEKLMKCNELRSFDIPVSLLDLAVEVERVG